MAVTPGNETVPAYKENLLRLEYFSYLPQNWAGIGSVPLDATVKEFMKSVLEESREGIPNVAMAPLPEGGLRFEFDKAGKFNIAEITADMDLYLCVLTDHPADSSDSSEYFDRDRYFEIADKSIVLDFLQDGIFP